MRQPSVSARVPGLRGSRRPARAARPTHSEFRPRAEFFLFTGTLCRGHTVPQALQPSPSFTGRLPPRSPVRFKRNQLTELSSGQEGALQRSPVRPLGVSHSRELGSGSGSHQPPGARSEVSSDPDSAGAAGREWHGLSVTVPYLYVNGARPGGRPAEMRPSVCCGTSRDPKQTGTPTLLSDTTH